MRFTKVTSPSHRTYLVVLYPAALVQERDYLVTLLCLLWHSWRRLNANLVLQQVIYHLGMRKKDVLKHCMSQANAIGRNFIIGVLAIHIVSILRLKEWIHQHVPPDLLFGRTQLSELPKIKDRAVHGRCFALILLEGLFAQPFLEQVLLRKPMSFATGIDLAELSTLLMRFTSGLKCWALTGLHSTKEFPLLNFKQPLMC